VISRSCPYSGIPRTTSLMNRETLGFHERLQLPVPLLDGFFRIVVPIDAPHGRGDVQNLVLRIDEDITAGRTQCAEQANRFVEGRRYCACPRSRSVANRRSDSPGVVVVVVVATHSEPPFVTRLDSAYCTPAIRTPAHF
jgi:hypothetical protein